MWPCIPQHISAVALAQTQSSGRSGGGLSNFGQAVLQMQTACSDFFVPICLYGLQNEEKFET